MKVGALVFVCLFPFVSRADEIEPEGWLGRTYWTEAFATPVVKVVELDLDGDAWSEFAVETEGGRLFALDLAGTRRWSYDLPAGRTATLRPADLDGDRRSELLVGVSESDRTSSLIAVSETGETLWRKSFGRDLTDVYVHSLRDAAGVRILVHFRNPVPAPFWVLDPTGEIEWTFDLTGELNAVEVARSKRGADPTIFLAQGGFGKGKVVLYALGGAGNLLWAVEPSGAQGRTGRIESVSALDLDGDGESEILLVTSLGYRRHQLCCISAAGEELWCRAAEGARGPVSLFAAEAGNLAVVHGVPLRAFDADGRISWQVGEGLLSFLGSPSFDFDSDGLQERVAVFRKPPWEQGTTEILAIAPTGRIARRWQFEGRPHGGHEVKTPAGTTVWTGAGRIDLRITSEGVRAFPSSGGSGLVGDYNHDGFVEALTGGGRTLALEGLPSRKTDEMPHQLWYAPADEEHGPVLTQFGSNGWIAAGGGASASGGNVYLPGYLRLFSPWGTVVWRQQIHNQVSGVWLGTAVKEWPPVYAVTGPEKPLRLQTPPDWHLGFGKTPETRFDLLAFSDQGSVQWRTPLPAQPTDLDGLENAGELELLAVALAGYPEDEDAVGVAVFEPSGSLRWQAATPGPVTHVRATPGGIFAAGARAESRQGFLPDNSFLLAFDKGGRLLGRHDFPGLPIAFEVADLDSDGRAELVLAFSRHGSPLRCYSTGGEPRWELKVGGSVESFALGDLDGDGRSEVAVGTRRYDSRPEGLEFHESGQVHAIASDGRVVLAAGLPGFPSALAIAPALPDEPATLFVAVEPRENPGRLLALEADGRVRWSYELGEKVVALSSRRENEGKAGVFYATEEGRIGLVAPAYRPPPLIAAPRLDVRTGQFAATLIPTGVDTAVELEVGTESREAWDVLDPKLSAGDNSQRLRWPESLFGLRDLGQRPRFRFHFEEREGPYSGFTDPIPAAARVPPQWRYLQKAVVNALIALLFVAGPASVLLYRRFRLRGPTYRDVSVRAIPGSEPSRWAIELSTGRTTRSYERPASESATIRAEAERIDSGQIHEERVRSLRRLLADQVFDREAAGTVFDSRRPTRLRLDLAELPDEAAELPWELLLLADASSGDLLRNVSLLRQVRSSSEEELLVPVLGPPLRILAVSPEIKTGPPVHAAEEEKRIAEVLDDAVRRNKVELETLRGQDARIDNLGTVLVKGFDVLHFIGHGGLFDDGRPYLELSDQWGDGHRIDLERLRELFLRRDRTTRLPFLVFLSSCHSAAGLVRFGSELLDPRRVLAMVAMQGTVESDSARLFAEGFYQTLLASGRIDHAAVRGRQGMLGVLEGEATLKSLDWAKPGVFTCLEDGRLFEWA